MIKDSQQAKSTKEFSELGKEYLQKASSWHNTYEWIFSLTSRTIEECPLSPFLFTPGSNKWL